MNPPSARSKNELLNQQSEQQEAKWRADNARRAKETADKEFPGEKWKPIKGEDGIYIPKKKN